MLRALVASIVLLVSTTATAAGLYIDPARLSQLPMAGVAWGGVLASASESTSSPDLSNQDDPTNVRVLAKALVAARTGNAAMRQQVIDAVMASIETENGGRTLALGRELAAYVIAADLVGMPMGDDVTYRSWLSRVRFETLDGMTLISTHEKRGNNWGTHAGASRIAASAYLGDQADVDRAARVFKGWLGNRGSYAGFDWGDLCWQANPSAPVGINPLGSLLQGHPVGGVLPDDQRRSSCFQWPPPKANYVYGALQGVVLQAALLERAGYPDVWTWEQGAVRRAFDWLHQQANYPADGDNECLPHIANWAYGTSYPAVTPCAVGKNIAFMDWTHRDGVGPSPTTTTTSTTTTTTLTTTTTSSSTTTTLASTTTTTRPPTTTTTSTTSSTTTTTLPPLVGCQVCEGGTCRTVPHCTVTVE